MGIYLLDRWSILSTSVHLLYDLNDAEYGFFRVGFQYENTPLSQILLDHETRFGFLKECRTVGNQVHGTLAIAGMQLLVAMKLFGAMYSTLTLKTLALLNSTLALIFWWMALRRGVRSLWVPATFALLFTFSGPVFTKLSMLFWGTHELVLLLHGALLCLTAGWIARPAGPLRSSVRLFAMGIMAAMLTLCNYSLLMPGLFTMGWLAAASGLNWTQRHRNWAGLGWIPFLFLMGIGGFFLTQSVMLRSMILSGLDYPDRINWEHPFGLSGKVPKQGSQQPFLFEQGGNWLDGDKWTKEVGPNALPMAPTAPPNAAGTGPEIWVRWGVLSAALWCSMSGVIWWIRGWFGPRKSPHSPVTSQPLSVYLSVYLMVAFLTITYLSLTTGLTQDAVEGIRPRYYAHLYPVAFAVLACWSCTGPRWIRLWPLATVLWFGFQDHQQMRGDNDQVLDRYDGARAWMQSKDDPEPAGERIGYGAASADFVAGTRILESYQSHNYWKWIWPAEMTGPVHLNRLRHRIEVAGSPSSTEWWSGVGFAYAILIPEARRNQFDEIKTMYPQYAEALESGYQLERSDLEGASLDSDSSRTSDLQRTNQPPDQRPGRKAGPDQRRGSPRPSSPTAPRP